MRRCSGAGLSVSLIALVALACGGPDSPADSGSGMDTGVRNDAGRRDAGTSDTGSSDAGSSDAGSSDAAPGDTGSSDADATDTGAPDADVSDAGVLDTGPFDASPSDTGAGPLECPLGGGCITATFGTSEYCLCNATRNWVAARAACQGVGLDLAQIDSAGEEAFLNMRLSFRRFWIGASDMAVEGDFSWVDGTLFWTGGLGGAPVGGAFTNWLPGEPDDVGGSGLGDCVLVETTGGWLDDLCDTVRLYRYVCER